MGLPAGLLSAGYAAVVRPVLFASYGGDPEAIHERLIELLAGPGSAAPLRALTGLLAGSEGRPVTVAGIDFPSRVGLAAGLDKDASAVLAWRGLGFGFAELGTVTGKAQPGNPRPRVFRLRDSKALVNRMGFNNPGAAAVAATLAERNVYRGNGVAGLPVGISIGKTKLVDLADAVEDYLVSLRLLAPHADYVAVNVSSPNTPGLRSLQDAGALAELVGALVTDASTAATVPEEPRGTSGVTKGLPPLPVFVKVAPDLTWAQLDEVLATCVDRGASGLIATNTTLARTGIADADTGSASEAGGLSGAPLTVRAREVVGYVASHTDLPVMGVGGVMTPADAMALFDAGADLVQLYTGFIYGGPGLPAAINALDVERQRS
ncbi:MAG: quinone-dependent dihydroorotate dehydrogenase [Actinobacteria bacterium]|nr:quinone-dependent dihydroorotate dehydrogenase [Actinomycetota bacterium]